MLAPGSVDLKITTTKVWATKGFQCMFVLRARIPQASKHTVRSWGITAFFTAVLVPQSSIAQVQGVVLHEML